MISNTNISERVSYRIINKTISWRCVTRPFRGMYVNCFNRFRFLAEVSTKLQKMHFLDNLKTITQEENMETRQMTLFFSSTFSDLTVCNIHFWIWKYSKFIFMWSPLWFILVCKIPPRLPIQTAHHTFLESRHPEVTKNLYYALFIRRSQIPNF